MSVPATIESPATEARTLIARSLDAVVVPPYYQDDYVAIWHGNNQELLSLMPACDLLLTDPPYGIGEGRRKQILSRANAAKATDYGDNVWDNQPAPDWMIGLARAKTQRQIIWGGNYYSLPPSRAWLVWDKDNGENDFADCELAWTNLETAVRKLKYRWAGMLQENMSDKETRYHPTQKPRPLMGWCIEKAMPCRTVLDPWMGSGTTLVAAKERRLTAFGIEADERQCENAAKRLSQEPLAL